MRPGTQAAVKLQQQQLQQQSGAGYSAVTGQAVTFLNPGAPPSPISIKQAQQLPATSLEIPPVLLGSRDLPGEPKEPPSPKSLCSTITAAKGREGRNSDAGWMPEVHESLARLSTRMETALADLAQELAELRSEAQKERSTAAAHLEQLEQRVDCAREDHMGTTLRINGLERDFAELRALGASQAECFERGLARESESRQELERAFSKDLKEQITLETERVHSAVMREMRERVDGQKSVRDEVQFQQQTLTRLNSRLDEIVMELRAELPRLGQDFASQKQDTEKLQALQGGLQSRMESLEAVVAEEASSRLKSEKSFGDEIRKFVTADMVRVRTEFAELLQRLDETRSELRGTGMKVESANERLEILASQTALNEEGLQSACDDLHRRTSQAEQEIRSALDNKVLESEASLRNWVNTSFMARLNAVEGSVSSMRPRNTPPHERQAAVSLTPVQVRQTVLSQPRPVAFIPG